MCSRRWRPDGASPQRGTGTTVVDGGHGVHGVPSHPPAVVVEHIVVERADVDHGAADD
ncbi:MAG TPA: hypothetical protein VIT64_05620 [Ilumatobacteraceae bacterium]